MSGMRWMRLLAAVGVVGLTAVTSGAARAEADPQNDDGTYKVEKPIKRTFVYTDASVTADIKARLDASELLRHADVDISTASGVVTLVGVVPSEFAKSRAIELAKSTPGVVRVNDMMRLNSSSPNAPSQN
jgi:osmotically-inducible protein OsmY